MNNDIFGRLNENQIKAVKATEGRIRVVAGAGSGKTRVLANRYAYLVDEIGIDPANIVCLTFTNKAAQEMKTRIRKMVNVGNTNDFICTIHGFCVKILRRDIYRLGFPSNFMIIDEDDSKRLAKQVFEGFNITKSESTVQKFLDRVGGFKMQLDINDGHRIYMDYMLPGCDEEKYKANELAAYLRLQLKYFAVDFQDIIYFALHLLENYPDVLEYWQNEINYLQVDEVQDCSMTDWKLLELLCGKYQNLFVVGDPDQAIYEWRGAKPDAFVNFRADETIILNRNYRSTSNILDVANSIIRNNENRVKKDLYTQKQDSCITIHHHAKNEKAEGEWIAKQIAKTIAKGGKASDFAILYRASYQSRFVEQALMQKNINYVIWGGIRFFERLEIKHALAYMRLVAYNDDLSFARIVNVPSRKFGKVSMEKLATLAINEKRSLFEALEQHIDEAPFNKPALKEFVELIHTLKDSMNDYSISDFMDLILKKSGLTEMFRLDGDQERVDNISELLHSIKYYEEINAEEEISIDKYLQDVALYTNLDCQKDTPTVKLMTIHQAKGLEFPYVFVVGLTEGIFPSHRTVRERKKDGLEEERRLMYVAVTRAENALFLTESEGYAFASGTNKFPSRFIREISDNLIKVDGNIDPELLMGTDMLVRQLDAEISEADTDEFAEGAPVYHAVFGNGEIVEYNEERDSYVVRFGNITRSIRPKFLRPGIPKNHNFRTGNR